MDKEISPFNVSAIEDRIEELDSKLFTYKEYLQFGQRCFDAARKNNSEWYFKYKDFSSYMNSKSEDK
jgi:hypothetical protein